MPTVRRHVTDEEIRTLAAQEVTVTREEWDLLVTRVHVLAERANAHDTRVHALEAVVYEPKTVPRWRQWLRKILGR